MTRSRRNFSMQAYWEHLVQDFEPLLRFKGSSQADWQAWRAEALPKLLDRCWAISRGACRSTLRWNPLSWTAT